jgi:protein-L-isoaspartate(D-aspartate) O-methyltransferase
MAEVRARFARRLQSSFGLRRQSVVEAFATVPRERFVGEGPWLVDSPDGYRATPDADPAHLYDDFRVALDVGRDLNNGSPFNHAGWLDWLAVNEGDRVVHIGAGTGYYTAILAAIVGETGTVTAIEVDPALLRALRRNTLDMRQVRVVESRGVEIDVDDADRFYVNCALTRAPASWLRCLTDGGTMILPLTEMMSATRHGGTFGLRRLHRNAYAAQFLGAIRMFPCEGGRAASDEPAIAAAFGRGGQERVRSLRVDAHQPAEDCWLHAESYCLSLRDPIT